MIVYRKAFLGLHLIFRLYGSAVVRTALWGALAALQTTLLYTLVGDHLTHFFEDGRVMAFTVFSTMLALLVIFRQQAGYGRFHEGRTRLQAMTAAWADAAIKALSFDGGNKTFGPPDAASLRFQLDVVHGFSLLHGLALQFLRSDWQMENVSEHDGTKLPPWDSANSPGYTPALVDYFVLRSVSHRRLRYNAAHPIPVVGPLSRQERAALTFEGERLHTLSRTDWDSATIKENQPGTLQRAAHYMFAASQGKYVRGAAERVYQVYHWTHERQRMCEGGLDMPGPVVATLYASLQKGLDSFEHCRVLVDTPFPFSWAQLIIFGLLCFQATLPFVIVSAIKDWALGISCSVIFVQSYWALNEVARELEDPYCFEPNDIPLPRLQYQMNERLLAAANTQLPGSSGIGAGSIGYDDDATFRAALGEAVRRAAAGSLGAPDPPLSEDAEALPV